ncbi:MAG: hypothetical protein Q9171_000286 [Xanthocarpia ochracea]
MGCFEALRLFVCSRFGQGTVPTTLDSFTESISEYKELKIVIRATEARKEEMDGTAGDRKLYETSQPTPANHARALLSPVVEELRDLIENDPLIHQLFTCMFMDIPYHHPFDVDPSGNPQIRHYEALLRHLDDIIVRAPEFNTTVMMGFPINALLAYPMATSSGIVAFLHEKVNIQIQKILNTWAIFLSSPESRYVLNADPDIGWLGSKALALMPDFAVDYVCNPVAPYFGFCSFDDFFTRQLRDGVRPVDCPNDGTVVANACESTPYRLAHGVRAYDQFWMKDQCYSLADMLADDPLSPSFYGGTVYQAYLGCTNYHRWHSPVSGTIRKAYGKPGAYYAQCPNVGFDKSAPNTSQAYLAQVATRAMIFIDADNSNIGLLCFMPVGIAECSSCEIRVSEGQRVEKGDEIGMFHFGGSTYCLIFRPETKVQFRLEATRAGIDTSVLKVNTMLARVD